jgi:hypothetical protein
MRNCPKQVISKLLSLFAEEAVGKLSPHRPALLNERSRARCHACCRVFRPQYADR